MADEVGVLGIPLGRMGVTLEDLHMVTLVKSGKRLCDISNLYRTLWKGIYNAQYMCFGVVVHLGAERCPR